MWINIVFAAIIAIYLVYYMVILITSETAKNAYAAINDKYSTFKQGTVDASGDAKVAFEAKFKSTTGVHGHEVAVKQDGSASYELKSDVSVSIHQG